MGYLGVAQCLVERSIDREIHWEFVVDNRVFQAVVVFNSIQKIMFHKNMFHINGICRKMERLFSSSFFLGGVVDGTSELHQLGHDFEFHPP